MSYDTAAPTMPGYNMANVTWQECITPLDMIHWLYYNLLNNNVTQEEFDTAITAIETRVTDLEGTALSSFQTWLANNAPDLYNDVETLKTTTATNTGNITTNANAITSLNNTYTANKTATDNAIDALEDKYDANGLLPISYGGTGASTASAARTALGVTPANIGAFATDAIIPVANGGTGANDAANARQNLGLTPTVLYSTVSGTNATVTLSSSAANFARLKVFYYKVIDTNSNKKLYFCSEIYSPNDKRIVLDGAGYANAYTGQWFYAELDISGTTITPQQEAYVNFTGEGSSYSIESPTAVYITRVEGYVF